MRIKITEETKEILNENGIYEYPVFLEVEDKEYYNENYEGYEEHELYNGSILCLGGDLPFVVE